ncbi:immunity protein Imm33 domain-containing protein [Rufibacter quisquiliarum]|uniref:Immunity protein Imm33 domain-containing protein n=1 Tax=Rufibacter quisquiliarum TaxID=1549639 RepID=A0A839GMR6_9BACT|nr:DUF2185 domain-containing protein [Rufibacter quisquiliarum]MBA9076217.1 hypothetical protein [Rufibacter quisquiliarum]
MASFFSDKKSSTSPQKAFKESNDTAVFTTKFVLDDKKEITYVTHESDDGAWQFFSDDEFMDFEKVAKVVGLGEIIERDRTVLELADMPIGHYAYRKNISDKWTVQRQEE